MCGCGCKTFWKGRVVVSHIFHRTSAPQACPVGPEDRTRVKCLPREIRRLFHWGGIRRLFHWGETYLTGVRKDTRQSAVGYSTGALHFTGFDNRQFRELFIPLISRNAGLFKDHEQRTFRQILSVKRDNDSSFRFAIEINAMTAGAVIQGKSVLLKDFYHITRLQGGKFTHIELRVEFPKCWYRQGWVLNAFGGFPSKL